MDFGDLLRNINLTSVAPQCSKGMAHDPGFVPVRSPSRYDIFRWCSGSCVVSLCLFCGSFPYAQWMSSANSRPSRLRDSRSSVAYCRGTGCIS